MADERIRSLEQQARRGDGDAALRLAVARVRVGELFALTRVDPREPRPEHRGKDRWPRLHLDAEKGGGDLTPRVRRAAVKEALARLGWPGARATWSWRAGCACGRSPGYVVRGEGARGKGDVFVDVYVDPSEREEAA